VASLRRWTVVVVLALFVIGFLVEVVDSMSGLNRFQLDVGFYGLVAGLIAAVFGTALYSSRHKDE
jgi:uncharacterized membrane protein